MRLRLAFGCRIATTRDGARTRGRPNIPRYRIDASFGDELVIRLVLIDGVLLVLVVLGPRTQRGKVEASLRFGCRQWKFSE